MSWPRLGFVKVVTVFDVNENRGKEGERLGKITERKGFENSVPDTAHVIVMSLLGKPQENYECSQRNTGDVPRCHSQGKLPVHLKCACSVPRISPNLLKSGT